MPGLMAQSKITWAEDKALQRCNLSADPGAKTEGGIERACSIPPLDLSLRDWPPSEKPSRQDAAKSTTGGHLPLTNTNPPQFHFPLDQHMSTRLRFPDARGIFHNRNRYERFARHNLCRNSWRISRRS